MSGHCQAIRVRRLGISILVANLFFWVYFAVSFARVAYPYQHDPWGHPSGSGYTFFGRSIGIVESPFTHSFYRVAFWVQFPSILLARLAEQLLFGHSVEDRFFEGISEGGWRLVVAVLLSFFQWHFIGWVLQKLWHRWFRHPPTG